MFYKKRGITSLYNNLKQLCLPSFSTSRSMAGEVVFKSNQRRVKQLYWHIEKETFAAATALRFRLQI